MENKKEMQAGESIKAMENVWKAMHPFDYKTKINNQNKESYPQFKLLNGEFYFRVSSKSKDGTEYFSYVLSQNPVEQLWETIRKENPEGKDKKNNSIDYEKFLQHFTLSKNSYIILIISRLNMILRAMHDELDEGHVIPDLGKKIDKEIEILKEIIDTVYEYSSQKSQVKDDDSLGIEQTVIWEFSKFGFWQIFTKNLKKISMVCIKLFQKDIEHEEIQAEFFSFQCDSLFVQEAEKSLPLHHSDWSYKEERAELRELMVKKIGMLKDVQTVKLRAAENQSYSFQLLQQQQAQLHAIQQQQYGGVSTNWNIGIAYRPPDSIFNISAGYQQGKANIQISMVPDEQASLLGATGFTAGVGPGNLGLSLNLNI
mmetsp:Transcript_28479/g.55547  ORF Transcript_28479/g.55547 Transcript_28479/m.55547 type:complete len:370 (+) Transcript_28479:49-1158(+)